MKIIKLWKLKLMFKLPTFVLKRWLKHRLRKAKYIGELCELSYLVSILKENN